MKMHAVANAVHCAKYAIWRKMMSEPRYLEGDDVALGINQDCDECGESEDDCTCSHGYEPDTLEEMYDDF